MFLAVLGCARSPSATSTVRLRTSGEIGQRRTPIVRPFQAGKESPPRGRRASTGVPGRSWSVLFEDGGHPRRLRLRAHEDQAHRDVTQCELRGVEVRRRAGERGPGASRAVRGDRPFQRTAAPARAAKRALGGFALFAWRLGSVRAQQAPAVLVRDACGVPPRRTGGLGLRSTGPTAVSAGSLAESALSSGGWAFAGRSRQAELAGSSCRASAGRCPAFAPLLSWCWRVRGAP